ncbi:spermatogenesis-associated protein 2-like isoform X2 [Brienomyrus brachyistius]|uniref:spermatogenesis-associated protein 2-like isoform X2 n=1 Tax=Brienomyrus brachyistius TaxID=42636 RepID=UPI0020B2E87F|nr:spermatogenesis-associated protein 2-like isoform X2 [Brienomyrus brachyistius]
MRRSGAHETERRPRVHLLGARGRRSTARRALDRCCTTFTGPYVYYLKEALCDADLRCLLHSMGYTREQELRLRAGDPPGGTAHLRRLAFELFLARAECRLLSEAAARRRGANAEAEALEARRGGVEELEVRRGGVGREEGRWRAHAERDRDRERAYLRRSARASRSVDVADSSGSWQPPPRPVLRASLSLRKEPRCLEPDTGPVEPPQAGPLPGRPRLQPRTPPVAAEPPQAFTLSSLDEPDLYIERGPPLQQPLAPPPPPRRPASRDFWGPRGQGVKCRGCGRWCGAPVAALQGEGLLCASCRPEAPQDYPKPCPRPPNGPEKPPIAPRPYLGKSASAVPSVNCMGAGILRCGFCNKPGASHTCISCSKVSCGTCVSLYAKDACGRRNPQHSFASHQQLGCRPGVLSHLVYR